MLATKERAYAKINLFLDVVALREDGFHTVKTVMHSISLCDTLTVRISREKQAGVRLNIKGNARLPADGRNLAHRAASLFLERSCQTACVEIELEKNIPIAAGMAGGSTDAAAVLRALNRLLGRPFAARALRSIAAELGSDVVYCLGGKTALCEGRGEIITPIPNPPRLCLVAAIADEHISTPSAYKALDGIYSDFDGSVNSGGERHYEALISALSERRVPSELFNIFEQAVLPVCPNAAKIKEKMYSLGATAALMSGSGPSVFGIFSDMDSARRAEAELRKFGFSAFSAESV